MIKAIDSCEGEGEDETQPTNPTNALKLETDVNVM